MGEQRFEFDIESGSGIEKKSKSNQCMMYKYGRGKEGVVKVSIEERQYKLERDE